MKPGIFSTPTSNEAEALKGIAAVLNDHYEELLREWLRVYNLIDIAATLSREDFESLCRRELNRLIGALFAQAYNDYWDEAGRVAREMTSMGLSMRGLCALIHFFEAACNQVLIKEGALDNNSMPALASFMHNTLSLVVNSATEARSAHFLEETTFSRTMEAAFKPKPPQCLPGLDLGIVFSPTPGQFGVGGDFYDLFTLADGTVIFTLGDASGRGAEAAGAAAMAKYMLRSFAAEHCRPAKILAQANQALPFFLGEHDLATALCGAYDRRSGELTLSVAGHPRPIYLPAGGEPTLIENGGPVLGIIPNVDYPEWVVTPAPDDVIFMYTDGLIEARRKSEFFAEKRVIETLGGNLCRPAQHCVDVVNRACLEFNEGPLRDDLTILALRIMPG